MYTRRRFFNLHTGFSACHTTHHTQRQQHTTQQQHTEKETEKDDRKREEKTKEKIRQDKTRWKVSDRCWNSFSLCVPLPLKRGRKREKEKDREREISWKNLISSANTGELQSFYCKLKDDYHRYLAEIATGEAKSKAVSFDFPVPQVVEELVEVFKVFPQDRTEQHSVEQIIETPAFSLAEKIVEMPVTQDARKDATGCEHACSSTSG